MWNFDVDAMPKNQRVLALLDNDYVLILQDQSQSDEWFAWYVTDDRYGSIPIVRTHKKYEDGIANKKWNRVKAWMMLPTAEG